MGWTLVRVGGTLVSALVTAILNAKDIKEIVSLFGFSIRWSLLTFLLFLGFVTWWIASLEFYKRRIENSQPHLIVLNNNHWHDKLFSQVDTSTFKIGERIYGVLQVWFINQPFVPTDASVAKDVTAIITLYDQSSKGIITVPGCFITTEAFDYAGNMGFWDKIESWPPNDEPRKVQVAIKWQEDDNAYGFGQATDKEDRRNESRTIKKGKHYVKIHLKGTRVKQEPFWFVLENHGKDGGLSLARQIKPPNLRKEGFQSQ